MCGSTISTSPRYDGNYSQTQLEYINLKQDGLMTKYNAKTYDYH